MVMSLEERVQRHDDILEIMKLHWTYGHFCNKGWNGKEMDLEQIISLFTADATWECPSSGLYGKGHEEISKLFCAMGNSDHFFSHSFTNPIIDVNGDCAEGKWLLVLGSRPGEKVRTTYGSYVNDYVRTEAGWRIKAIRLYLAEVLEAS